MSNNNIGLSILRVISQLNAQGFTQGNDLVDASSGAREYDGLGGNDTLSYFSATTAVTASLLPGALNAGAALGHKFQNIENLTGSKFADRLTGDDGDNVLDGGIGADTLTGGRGNDTYVVDNRSDTTIERLNEGIDTVRTTITWTLGANLENLTLTGTAAINGTGNTLNNIIIGNSARNTLTGGAGNDTLDGGAGADTLVGGAGNDIYFVDHASDRVTETANAGLDTVHASVSYTLGAHVENLILIGTANVNGTGNTMNNELIGNAGNNFLNGGAGNDTLNGGAGNDTLIGGTGDDIYVVDNAADIVTEAAKGGIDTVRSTAESFILRAHVEDLELVGTGNINGTGNELGNRIIGNSGANLLNGMAGDDSLFGQSGADRLNGGDGLDFLYGGEGSDDLYGDAGDDELFGDAGDDNLYGGIGNDNLYGGAGADKMRGGQGDDTYSVTSTKDEVIEEENQGYDIVKAWIDYYLAGQEHIEELSLMGEADIGGFGNSANNKITGNEGNNFIDGGGGEDDLHGGAGDDTILVESGFVYGGTGNDRIEIEVGSGSPTLSGGDGDDTYDVLGNYIIVEEAGGGLDTVISNETFTLGANIENGVLRNGTASDRLIGNALNNRLTLTGEGILEAGDGDDKLILGTGNNVLYGGHGNDIAEFSGAQADYVFTWDAEALVLTASGADGTYRLEAIEQLLFSDGLYEGSFADLAGNSHKTINGTDSGDTLTGGRGNDVIYGGKGHDILDGRGGSDTMYGGDGDDIYVVEQSDDIVREEPGEGMDLVRSSAVHFVLSANVENLELIGSGSSADGNGLANELTGNEIVNHLRGHGGHDVIFGGAGDDNLFGGEGDDTLYGGTGDDQLLGEAGHDTIYGQDGDDSLYGGACNDTLYGGDGADTFFVGEGIDALYGGGNEGDIAKFGLDVHSYTFSWNAQSNTLTASIGGNVFTLNGFAAFDFNGQIITDVHSLWLSN